MVTTSAFLLMDKPAQEKLSPWYEQQQEHLLISHLTYFYLKFQTCIYVNHCIFIQTGPRDLTEHSQGVNYRALRDLFMLAEQRKDTFCYDVSVQMIEIYNEQVRDLLNSDGLNRRYPFQCQLISRQRTILFKSKTSVYPWICILLP